MLKSFSEQFEDRIEALSNTLFPHTGYVDAVRAYVLNKGDHMHQVFQGNIYKAIEFIADNQIPRETLSEEAMQTLRDSDFIAPSIDELGDFILKGWYSKFKGELSIDFKKSATAATFYLLVLDVLLVSVDDELERHIVNFDISPRNDGAVFSIEDPFNKPDVLGWRSEQDTHGYRVVSIDMLDGSVKNYKLHSEGDAKCVDCAEYVQQSDFVDHECDYLDLGDD